MMQGRRDVREKKAENSWPTEGMLRVVKPSTQIRILL